MLWRDVDRRLVVEHPGTSSRHSLWATVSDYRIQQKLPPGATIAPIILASDKTKLSQHSGDKTAWPIYLTLGNITSSVRRQPSQNTAVLLGYLPVTKLMCFNKDHTLFHQCMAELLKPLIQAGTDGVKMLCPDGHIRWIFPLLAAYVADHPEQCLIACCKENRCVRCTVHPNKRGDLTISPARDPLETSAALKAHAELRPDRNMAHIFQAQGLKPTSPPFWANLPHTNIFPSLTPDLLHQVHKGVFYNHLYTWCERLIGEKELDARWKATTNYPGLKHFHHGISSISQWTGNEFKEMERCFIGVVAGALRPDALKAARSIMDFVMYAQYSTHTTESLDRMSQSLATFHQLKHEFLHPTLRPHFNIPKLHAISHYVEAIKSRGSAVGFNTELPERLHIEFAKKGYRRSNKKKYTQQMAQWLERQEAICKHNKYLDWLDIPRRTSKDLARGQPSKHTARKEKGDQETTVNIGQRRSEIAKHPTYPRTTITSLVQNFGAVDFLSCLHNFFKKTLSPRSFRPPTISDTFDLFRLVRIHVTSNDPSISLKNTIRASPSTPQKLTSRGLQDAVPAYFDTVLLTSDGTIPREIESIKDKSKSFLHAIPSTMSHCCLDLRVVQVRAIFKTHKNLAIYPHPLAYVEYFTNFKPHADPSSGFFEVSRIASSVTNKRQSAVIPLDTIYRGCHLLPKFGRSINSQWNSANILDVCKNFYLNDMIDQPLFQTL